MENPKIIPYHLHNLIGILTFGTLGKIFINQRDLIFIRKNFLGYEIFFH